MGAETVTEAETPTGSQRQDDQMRILLLMAHETNREVLSEWLSQDYEVVDDDGPDSLEESFDLCILDRGALDRHGEALYERKQREQPVILPYLLVVPERALEGSGPSVWRQVDGVLEESIDELITTPVKKAELRNRIRNLLNKRSLSLHLREQRDALAKLNRLNETIRDIDQALVRESSHEAIEQAICEELAATERYAFVWVGRARANSTVIEPRASAGEGEEYLEAVTVTTSDGETGQGPSGRAIRTGETQVVDDIADAPEFEPWREEALAAGFRSSIAVPLNFGETTYGVLNIYATEPGAFDEEEREVLGEFGTTIAHAITATESRRALLVDRRRELEFRVDDGEQFLYRASAELDCTFTLEGIVTQSAERYLEYFATDAADPQAVLDAAADDGDVERARLVAEDEDGALLEFTFTRDIISRTFGEFGATIESLSIEEGRARLVAEVPYDTDVHTLVGSIQERHGNVELLAQRETERSRKSEQETREEFLERLTDRQWSVLQTAYYAGYFDWPRESSGEEIAESLDISPSTLHEHLRTAQRKLLATLLE